MQPSLAAQRPKSVVQRAVSSVAQRAVSSVAQLVVSLAARGQKTVPRRVLLAVQRPWLPASFFSSATVLVAVTSAWATV